jgi:hypothetical protein
VAHFPHFISAYDVSNRWSYKGVETRTAHRLTTDFPIGPQMSRCFLFSLIQGPIMSLKSCVVLFWTSDDGQASKSEWFHMKCFLYRTRVLPQFKATQGHQFIHSFASGPVVKQLCHAEIKQATWIHTRKQADAESEQHHHKITNKTDFSAINHSFRAYRFKVNYSAKVGRLISR